MSFFPRQLFDRLYQLALATATATCLQPCALALPSPLLADYNHSAWGPRNGAPNDIVQFAQTTDGWLWLASPNGLYRFDGVRFARMDSFFGKRLHSTNVLGLLATPDGALWIGHRFGGISQVQHGRLVLHRPGEGLPVGSVFSIARGPDGAIWASTTNGLAHLAPGADRFVAVASETGLPRVGIHKVLFTRDGRQWVATGDGPYYREPNEQHYRRGWPHLELPAMDQAPDGTVWASDGVSKHYRVLAAPPRDPRDFRPVPGGHGLHFDRNGIMWVLKDSVMERRMPPYLGPGDGSGSSADGARQHIGQNNGMSGPVPQMWFQDREANIWVGTSAGIDRLRRNRVEVLVTDSPFGHPGVIPDANGRIFIGDKTSKLHSADARGVRGFAAPIGLTASYRAPDGTLWAGESDARWRREPDGRWTRYPHPHALLNHDVQAMLAAPDGRMWVALRTLGLFLVDGDDWRHNGGHTALPRALVLSLAADTAKRTWVGYAGNQVARIDKDHVRLFGEADGLKLGSVHALLADQTRVWAGGEQGIAFFEGGHWTSLNAPLRGVSGIVRTPDGDLWLHGSEGITRIDKAEVERVLREPERALLFERFDALDGLRGSAEQLRPVPSLTEGSDGRLWFGTSSDVASMDPRAIPRNRLAPQVHIVSLKAGGRNYDGAHAKLPVGSSELQIAYTALSLSIPERVRFRYRLHGFDRAWQEAGARREAFYTNLEPGTYRFQVSAANEDGVWNTTGAQVHVTIPPRFVQTRWFAVLVALLVAVVLYCLYRLRVRHLTRRMNDLLHVRLTERARIARGLHDTLLQSVQGLIMFFNQQARRLPHGTEERAKIEQTLELADQLMSEGRDYILDLRAASEPRELGEALEAYGRVLLQERLLVSVTGRPRALIPHVRDELMAIAREALFNCARHAEAGKVDLLIDYGRDSLQLRVRDDGRGKAQERDGHYGLCGMRERALAMGATLTLLSRPGHGTLVDIEIPSMQAYTGMAGLTTMARLRRRLSDFRAA